MFDGTLEWRLCKRCSTEEKLKPSLMLALLSVQACGFYALKAQNMEDVSVLPLLEASSTHRLGQAFLFLLFHLFFLANEVLFCPFFPMLDTYIFSLECMELGWGGVWHFCIPAHAEGISFQPEMDFNLQITESRRGNIRRGSFI